MLSIAIIGMGVRGQTYANILLENKDKARLVAVCDGNVNKLEIANKKYNVNKDMCYINDSEFFSAGKLADALLVCSSDINHFNHVMKALDLGYDLLLEKPISVSVKECVLIEEKAKQLGRNISVCHVLRYSVFSQTLKSILDSDEIGSVVSINQIERVGYFHQAHSFVRGNWRNKELSSPMILSKCSHDLDLISYFSGGKCSTVSSFGDLMFFNKLNQPENSAGYCYKCSVKDNCVYNCIKFYQENESWTKRTGRFFDEFNNENIEKWLSDESNPYARCVFCCDNNVVDNQVVNMLFDNGVCATLTMTGFSSTESRKISIFCTKGEIESDMETNIITIKPFGKETYEIDVNKIDGALETHCGGDKGLLEDFLCQLENSNNALYLTTIDKSVHSHKIGFMAEKSRENGGLAIEIK